ncbi:hypothetical protein LguiA_002010 [Lonicera macranthoides]
METYFLEFLLSMKNFTIYYNLTTCTWVPKHGSIFGAPLHMLEDISKRVLPSMIARKSSANLTHIIYALQLYHLQLTEKFNKHHTSVAPNSHKWRCMGRLVFCHLCASPKSRATSKPLPKLQMLKIAQNQTLLTPLHILLEMGGGFAFISDMFLKRRTLSNVRLLRDMGGLQLLGSACDPMSNLQWLKAYAHAQRRYLPPSLPSNKEDIDDCQKPLLEPYAKFSEEDYDRLKTSLGQRWSPDVELYYRKVLRSHESIPTNPKDLSIEVEGDEKISVTTASCKFCESWITNGADVIKIICGCRRTFIAHEACVSNYSVKKKCNECRQYWYNQARGYFFCPTMRLANIIEHITNPFIATFTIYQDFDITKYFIIFG